MNSKIANPKATVTYTQEVVTTQQVEVEAAEVVTILGPGGRQPSAVVAIAQEYDRHTDLRNKFAQDGQALYGWLMASAPYGTLVELRKLLNSDADA